MSIISWLAAVAVLFCGVLVAGQADEVQDSQPQFNNSLFELPEHQQSWTFRDLAGSRKLRVDGVANRMVLGFGGRADQVVTEASLDLMFIYSPTLVRDVSQLRIIFNGEVVHAIALPVAKANEHHQLQIQLRPELFARYNELEFELLAEARGAECAVISPSAWLEFTAGSLLRVTSKQLVVANDLSWFPEPFFDVRDFTRLKLAYMLPQQLSHKHVQAAAILTSYFGVHADWRGLETSLFRYGELSQESEPRTNWPQQHAIMLMTNTQRPWQLKHMEDVTKPRVQLITNPVHKAYKVLLIQAPDAGGLVSAVQGLVGHTTGLSGPVATIEARSPEPRDIYQAPRWVSTKQPVSFSELVNFPADLQRIGYQANPVSVNLRFPPDLFTWQRRGIPVDLKFRYTPPVQLDESRMRVSVNGEFIKGYNLNESGLVGDEQRIRVPLLSDNPFTSSTLQIPAFKIGALNRLDFEFIFSALTEECRIRPLNNTLGAIDGDSTIDLRGYSHYTQMPNLHLFAKAGYPFSRYDDLSQTLLLMEADPSDEVVNTVLVTAGLFGAVTGYPGVLLDVATVEQVHGAMDKDILIVGKKALRAWLQRFGRAGLDKQLQPHQLAGQTQLMFSTEENVAISGPSAAIVSFESPLMANRTVIAMTANQNEFLPRIGALLLSAERSNEVSGFMAILTPGAARYLPAPSPYYVGNLNVWDKMYYHLSRYPLLVAVMTLISLIALVLVLYWFFAGIARRRTRGAD